MAQSLAQVYIHLVFSTKNRQPVIAKALQPRIWAYLAGIAKEMDCPAISIDGVEDHIHALVRLSRTCSISQLVGDVKTGSSQWMKSQDDGVNDFQWQNGYAAFSVSQSNVPRVIQYIAEQEKHHQKLSFQDELREFLKRHNVEYDERYVWD